MLECEDIQTSKLGRPGLTLFLRDEDGTDVCTEIHMKESAAIDMARWIMQNWGNERYLTLEEARKIILKEGAEKL